uniref:Short-chain dehydrogenase n=1 Tax=Elaeophora elaphi TaxID=1147741 RepID=A0A0R3RVV0_9BILA
MSLGYHAALQLCAKGYCITIACRNIDKAKNACASIIKRSGNNASIDFIIIDMSELSLVSKSVNYLSQFYLLNELIGVATPKEGVKIIALTSTLHKFLCPKISLRRDRLQKMFSPPNGTSGWLSYARSKLSIAMLACYLDRIEGIQATAVHPGAVSTSLSNNISPHMRKILKTMHVSRFLSRVEDGARNVVECVEKSHLPNTFRNGTKYNTVSKRISSERNGINLMMLARK